MRSGTCCRVPTRGPRKQKTRARGCKSSRRQCLPQTGMPAGTQFPPLFRTLDTDSDAWRGFGRWTRIRTAAPRIRVARVRMHSGTCCASRLGGRGSRKTRARGCRSSRRQWVPQTGVPARTQFPHLFRTLDTDSDAWRGFGRWTRIRTAAPRIRVARVRMHSGTCCASRLGGRGSRKTRARGCRSSRRQCLPQTGVPVRTQFPRLFRTLDADSDGGTPDPRSARPNAQRNVQSVPPEAAAGYWRRAARAAARAVAELVLLLIRQSVSLLKWNQTTAVTSDCAAR